MQPRPSLPLIHALYVCSHHDNKLRVAWSLHKRSSSDLIQRVPVPVGPAGTYQRPERMFHGMRLHAEMSGCLRVQTLGDESDAILGVHNLFDHVYSIVKASVPPGSTDTPEQLVSRNGNPALLIRQINIEAPLFLCHAA